MAVSPLSVVRGEGQSSFESTKEHKDVQNQSGPYHEIFSRVLA